MRKEEILQKAQSKKPNTPDEMELQIIQKGSGIAVFCILVLALILMIAKMIADQPWYDVYSICFVSIGAQHIYKGIRLRRRHEIVIGVVTSVISVIMLVSYLLEILG